MPNGESKNWIRFLITLESFYALYDSWPTSICLHKSIVDELKSKLSMEDFEKLGEKINLLIDEENLFLAFNNEGQKFDYLHDSIPSEKSNIKTRAIDWLEIEQPSYFD